MPATAALRLVDSITELSAQDAGCVAVSGSHGGISSVRYALAARPLLSVFNDAGVGRDSAGIAVWPLAPWRTPVPALGRRAAAMTMAWSAT
jgi:hypothetical protein